MFSFTEWDPIKRQIKEHKKYIGTVMKKQRKAKGIKQKELAQAVGVSPTMISNMEHGYGNFCLKILVRIAETLGLSLTITLEPKQEATNKKE